MALTGGELAVGDEAGQQLGVVDHLIVPAQLRVLPGDRVEAIGGSWPRWCMGGLIQGLDVLLGEHGEHELVPDPPGRL